ncbi:MAG: hypothetical protein IMZ67_04765 [Acidobacteria bacterium]|nr:hypothetical protein [Acidobacteriota bacterium]
MILTPLDWAILALYSAVSLPYFGVAMIAVWIINRSLSRRGRKSIAG